MISKKLSVLISKTDAYLYALILFISFLLNALISLLTHEDFIKLYLCGALTRIILAWLFILMKFLMCLKAVFELFFETSFAPPQRITSFFVKLAISLFSEFTSIPAPAPSFTSP